MGVSLFSFLYSHSSTWGPPSLSTLSILLLDMICPESIRWLHACVQPCSNSIWLTVDNTYYQGCFYASSCQMEGRKDNVLINRHTNQSIFNIWAIKDGENLREIKRETNKESESLLAIFIGEISKFFEQGAPDLFELQTELIVSSWCFSCENYTCNRPKASST